MDETELNESPILFELRMERMGRMGSRSNRRVGLKDRGIATWNVIDKTM